MIGEVYEINNKGGNVCRASMVRKRENCGGSVAQKRAREEQLIVLAVRKEREETGRVEGTAHMLSHCF